MTKNLILALAVCLGAVSAQERFDLKVRNYFFAGFAGDAASLEKGMKICEDILTTDPKNAEALVWHGAGVLFESGRAFRSGDQQKGGEFWQRGLHEMDQAVELAPDDVGVRIPRGAVVLTAAHRVPNPELAKQLLDRGIADFEKAYEVQGPTISGLSIHSRGELFIGLASAYNQLGNQERAYVWFERMQREMKGTPYEKSAAKWMDTKSLSPAESGCLGCHTGSGSQ